MATAFQLLTIAAALALGRSLASANGGCVEYGGDRARFDLGGSAEIKPLEAVVGVKPTSRMIAGRATSAPSHLGTTGANRSRTSAPPHLGTTGRTYGSGLDTGVGSGAGSVSQRGATGK